MYVNAWTEYNLMRALYGNRPVRAPPRQQLLEAQQQHLHDQLQLPVATGSDGASTAAPSSHHQQQQLQQQYNAQQYMPSTSRSAGTNNSTTTTTTASTAAGTASQQIRRGSAARRNQAVVRLQPMSQQQQQLDRHQQQSHPQHPPSTAASRRHNPPPRLPTGPASDPGTHNGGRGGGGAALTTLLRTSRTTNDELQSFVQHGTRFLPPSVPPHEQQQQQQLGQQQQQSAAAEKKKLLSQKSSDPVDRQRRRELLARMYAEETPTAGIGRGAALQASGESSPLSRAPLTLSAAITSSVQDFAGVFSCGPSSLSHTVVGAGGGALSPVAPRQQPLHLPPLADPVQAQANAQFVGRSVWSPTNPQQQHHQKQQQPQQQQQQALAFASPKSVAGLINANVFSLLKRATIGSTAVSASGASYNNNTNNNRNNNGTANGVALLPFQAPVVAQQQQLIYDNFQPQSQQQQQQQRPGSGFRQQQRAFDVGVPVLLPPAGSTATTALFQQERLQHPYRKRTPSPPLQDPTPRDQQHPVGASIRIASRSTVSSAKARHNIMDVGVPLLRPPVYDPQREQPLDLESMHRNLLAQHERLQREYAQQQAWLSSSAAASYQKPSPYHLREHVVLGSEAAYANSMYESTQRYEDINHHNHTGDARVGMLHGGTTAWQQHQQTQQQQQIPAPLDVDTLREMIEHSVERTRAADQYRKQQQQQLFSSSSSSLSRPNSSIAHNINSTRSNNNNNASAQHHLQQAHQRSVSPVSPMSASFGMPHDPMIGDLLKWAKDLPSASALL